MQEIWVWTWSTVEGSQEWRWVKIKEGGLRGGNEAARKRGEVTVRRCEAGLGILRCKRRVGRTRAMQHLAEGGKTARDIDEPALQTEPSERRRQKKDGLNALKH